MANIEPAVPLLPLLPDVIGLTGDEDGGVTLTCEHPEHGHLELMYLGYSAPAGMAVAEDVNDLIRSAYLHAAGHPDDDDEDRPAAAAGDPMTRRCESAARHGTGVGLCGEPLDSHGQCPRASSHLDL